MANETSMKFIRTFRQLKKDDIQTAGGKGANLGELTRIGMPVPPGFVITTAGYEKFVAENQLQESIVRALRKSKDGAAIREIFLKSHMPQGVEQEISKVFSELRLETAAVRSSATAEDLPGAAFAGQQDTYLNIREKELFDAVKKVWASLWTERAIAYRERLGIDHASVKIAVVVQQMVDAKIAGVMFTANTITGAREETTIDASPGLGEAVVSGEVVPTHLRLKKRLFGWTVVERRKGQYEVKLDDRTLRKLARLGKTIERHFDSPQDIEWAMADNKLYILQARPITALPAPVPKAGKLARFMASNFAEIFAFRPYPLDMETWIATLGSALEPLVGLLGVRWSLKNAFELEDGVAVKFNINFPHPTIKTLLAPFSLLSLAYKNDPLRWQSDPQIAKAQARARDLESRDLTALSWNDLLKSLTEAREITFIAAGDVRRRYFPGAAFAAARLRLFLFLVRRGANFGVLLSGVPNKTIEANRELEKLADLLRSGTDVKDPDFVHKFEAFLDRYGHRESVLGSAHEPTWKDAPELVLDMIHSFAKQPAEQKNGTPEWQKARNEVLKLPLLRLAFLHFSFLSMLAKARLVLQIREDTHFYATLSLPIFRRTLFECGNRLVRVGILEREEDIFHLTLDELEKIDDANYPSSVIIENLRAAVARRKKKRTELKGKPLVDPRVFMSNVSMKDAIVSGMPGAPGIAAGPARIVRSPTEFKKLVKGDVLVAPFTNPAWTPLFERAVAVVVDSGSVGSHAAIVAREYGIPAVMGTVEGTTKLKNGTIIRVDGTRGAVFAVTK
jgi:rifampicin phosphotransferase